MIFSQYANNFLTDTQQGIVLDYIDSKAWLPNKRNQYFVIRAAGVSVFVNDHLVIFIEEVFTRY